MRRQEGRHVVITGAGTGIGRAIAVRLAREGAIVSLLGRRANLLAETMRECDGAATFACDQRDTTSVDGAFSAAFDTAGPIHALVANAGIGGANLPGEGDRFFDLVDTNLAGTYRCLRAAQRHLAPGPGARHFVVNASVLARFGVPGYTGYCASKAGLLGLVRAFALEVAAENVQVNAICPGWVSTDMAMEGIAGMASAMGVSVEEAHRRAMSAVPLGRMGTPEEIAGMVAWLLSADAAGVTGQAIDQNGGSWMG